MISKCICLFHCHCLCLCPCHCFSFWSGHVSSSLWSNVSKVTSLLGHSVVLWTLWLLVVPDGRTDNESYWAVLEKAILYFYQINKEYKTKLMTLPMGTLLPSKASLKIYGDNKPKQLESSMCMNSAQASCLTNMTDNCRKTRKYVHYGRSVVLVQNLAHFYELAAIPLWAFPC